MSAVKRNAASPASDDGDGARNDQPLLAMAEDEEGTKELLRRCAQTDWTQIVRLYDVLLQLSPSPVVRLNRAVAVAMRDGAEAGLSLVDELLAQGELQDYHLSHAARADLLRQLARPDEAREAYRSALRLVQLEPERRFLQRQLDGLDS